MKINKKKFSLLLFIYLMMGIPLISTVLAQDTDSSSLEVTTEWIKISLTSWNGKPITDDTYDGKLKFAKGGYGLANVVNHGLLSWDESTHRGVYMTEMQPSFYALAFTDCLVADCVTYNPTGATKRYLNLMTFAQDLYSYANKLNWDWSEATMDKYGFLDPDKNRYDVKYSTNVVTGVNNRDYNGALGIKVEIADELPNGAKPGETVNMFGVDYTLNNYSIVVKNIKVETIDMKSVGDYNACYTNDINEQITATESESKNSGYANPSTDNKSGAKNTCNQQSRVNSRIDELGAKDVTPAYGITENLYGQISGQYALYGGCAGQVYDSSQDLNTADNIFEFTHSMRVKPEITMDVNNFEVKKTCLGVDVSGISTGIKKDWEQETSHMTQILGFKVKNFVVKVKFSVTIDVYADVSVEGKIEDGELSDPALRHGDTLTNSYMSQDDANVPLYAWWGEEWWNNFLDWASGVGEWWENAWDDIMANLADYWWIWAIIGVAIVLVVITIISKPIRKKLGFGKGGNVSNIQIDLGKGGDEGAKR